MSTLPWGFHETRWPGAQRGFSESLHGLKKGLSTLKELIDSAMLSLT